MVNDRIRQLTTKKGFTEAFWDKYRSAIMTHEAAYNEIEKEYISYFGRPRYKNYNSFRRRRDIKGIDLEADYLYVFYAPGVNLTFVGVTPDPEKLYKSMVNSNPNLVYSSLRLEYDADRTFEILEDYKVADKTYRIPALLRHFLVGPELGKYSVGEFSEEARDLMIKHRNKSGVYVFEGEDGDVLYVGLASDLHVRPRQSFSERFQYYHQPLYLKFIPCNLTDCAVLESYLIAKHQPLFNIRGTSSSRLTLQMNNMPKSTDRVLVNNMT